MPSMILHIPAWRNAAKGEDVAPKEIRFRLDHLPRVGDQITTPGGGLVEVVTVRHQPLWTPEDESDSMTQMYGPGYAFSEREPYIGTNWVNRPLGAKVTRSGVAHL